MGTGTFILVTLFGIIVSIFWVKATIKLVEEDEHPLIIMGFVLFTSIVVAATLTNIIMYAFIL